MSKNQKRKDNNISTFSKGLIGLAVFGVFIIAIAVVSSTSDDTTTTSNASQNTSLGKKVYTSSCASCHGSDLKGTDKGPSHLSRFYEPNHHSDQAFRLAITNGAKQHHWNFGDMLPIPGLSDEEIEAVISYVRSEQVRQGFEQ